LKALSLQFLKLLCRYHKAMPDKSKQKLLQLLEVARLEIAALHRVINDLRLDNLGLKGLLNQMKKERDGA